MTKNEIIREILEILEKNNTQIHSINPIYDNMLEINAFNELFQEAIEDKSFALDSVYIVYIGDGSNLLIPIVDDRILEKIILDIDMYNLNRIFEFYNKLKKKIKNKENLINVEEK